MVMTPDGWGVASVELRWIGLGVNQESATARPDEGIVLQQIGLVLQELWHIQGAAIFAAFPGNRACFESSPASVAHPLLNTLLEFGFQLFTGLDFSPDCDQVREGT